MRYAIIAIILLFSPQSVLAIQSESYSMDADMSSGQSSSSDNFSMTQNVVDEKNSQSESFSFIAKLISIVGSELGIPQQQETPSQSSTGQAAGGGAGGAGGINAQVPQQKQKDFSISIDQVAVRLLQAEEKSVEIGIANTGKEQLDVDIKPLGDIREYIILDKNKISLKPGGLETLRLKFFGTKNPGDIITGSLEFHSGEITKKIPVTMIVIVQKEKLLDLKVELIKDTALPGEDMGAQISVFNLGTAGRVDIQLEYSLIRGQTISAAKETLAIETQTTLFRKIKIPEDSTPGTYIFRVNAVYDNKTAQSESSFHVLSQKSSVEEHAITSQASLIFTGMMIVILILFVLLVKRASRRPKRVLSDNVRTEIVKEMRKLVKEKKRNN